MISRDDALIVIDHVGFTYPTQVEALHDIHLTIRQGEGVGIIGENGAGKSTLVKHLNGLLKPTQGLVEVGGHDTRQYSAAAMARWVGLCFQNPDDQLFQRTVEAEVSLGPRKLGFDAQDVAHHVRWALELVGMGDQASIHPYDLDLSGRKLVAIAAILAMDTPVVVLDEPTTGQDQVGIEVLAQVVKRLREMDKTVITISHDMDFVARNFPRVVAMANARVLLDGTAEAVFNDVQVLSQSGVEPPLLTQLSHSLNWDEAIFDTDAFVALFQRRSRTTTRRNTSGES